MSVLPEPATSSDRDSVAKPVAHEGAINQDELYRKLQNIPIETLRDILTNQIDLEIRLKHNELKLTEEEIGKCESQIIMLRKFFEIPNSVSFKDEPTDFTLKYFDLLNKSLSVSYTNLQKQNYRQGSAPHDPLGLGPGEGVDPNSPAGENYHLEPVHTYRTRSTTSSLRPSFASSSAGVGGSGYGRTIGCLYRRTDGVIVKLTCPDCQRSNFSSAQGFLNHSRIAHAKEYTSQDAAALKCGQILPDKEQDEEGLTSLSNLKAKNLDPNQNLNVNEIYFNGLSNSLNTVHRSSVSRSNSVPEKTEMLIDSAHVAPASKEVQQTQAEPKPRSELMKKLMRSGIANSEEDYEQLIKEARDEVKLAHLFEDEEEGDDSDPAPPTVAQTNSKLKRRKSRSAMGITKASTPSATASKATPKVEKPQEKPREEKIEKPRDGEVLHTRSKSRQLSAEETVLEMINKAKREKDRKKRR